MCLHSQSIKPVPPQTVRIAKAAFPKGNPYLTLHDEFGTVFNDEDFAELFALVGQPALPPWRVALVTVPQFKENLSDRQAADAVRSRIDWKYLLGLELTDEGFHFSVLSEFRKRLVENKQEHLLLDKLLLRCNEQGLLKARGQQRTDATRVLASIRKLNRLELVGETMRAALNELAVVAPEWLSAFAFHSSLAGKKRYQRRAGIEGALSQGVRGFGLRRSRYRGLAKTHLQNMAIGTAINLDRLVNYFNDVPTAKTRTSRFKELQVA